MANSANVDRRQIPGTLLRVHQRGVLITGKPGSGKSDTALGLLQAGHQLVADDAVLVDRQNTDQVTGYAPTAGLGLLFIRGIGLIDARKHFGGKAILPSSMIHLRVHIGEHQILDTGIEDWQVEAYHGVRIPTLYLSPMRPLTALIRLAAAQFVTRQDKCD